MIMNKILARCCTFIAMVVLGVAAEAPGFKVTKKYPVPGNGGFDYIVFDSSSNRLYVSHGTEVDVLDADSGKVLGRVADTPGVHGIAIVPNLHRGFTTNGSNATVSVFDTDTFKTVKKISVDKDPDFTLSIRGPNECWCAMAMQPPSPRSIPRSSKSSAK
jgi:DNA-binding beta-propeller fold protein YncE